MLLVIQQLFKFYLQAYPIGKSTCLMMQIFPGTKGCRGLRPQNLNNIYYFAKIYSASNCLPIFRASTHELVQLSDIIRKVSLNSGWWLTQGLTNGKSVENKHPCSAQPQIGQLYHILYLSLGECYRKDGRKIVRTQVVYCSFPLSFFNLCMFISIAYSLLLEFFLINLFISLGFVCDNNSLWNI